MTIKFAYWSEAEKALANDYKAAKKTYAEIAEAITAQRRQDPSGARFCAVTANAVSGFFNRERERTKAKTNIQTQLDERLPAAPDKPSVSLRWLTAAGEQQAGPCDS